MTGPYTPPVPEVRDPITRGLLVTVLLLLLANTAMVIYLFVVVYRVVDSLGQLSG